MRRNQTSANPETVLLTAVAALEVLRRNQCTLDEYLDREIHDSVLRKRLSNLLFTLYRRKRFIDEALQKICSKAPAFDVYALLAGAAAMARYQTSLPAESVVNIAVTAAKKQHNKAIANFVNAVLRKLLPGLPEETDSPALPQELYRRWQKEFGRTETEKLNQLFQEQSVSTIRLRSGAAIAQASANLQELDLALPWKFFAAEKLSELLTSESFQQGAFYIQDPAPAKVCMLLQKYIGKLPITVDFIDLCAAPGGKLIMNMELLQSAQRQVNAVAVDRSTKRLELVRKNLERCKLSANLIAADAAAVPQLPRGRFDLVTCDVPCSNSGVFRRRPDALWRWKAADLPSVCALQANILDNAGTLTAPGGLLLYSTCSLEKEENALQIEKFLANNSDFTLLDMQLFMPDGYCDGTFAALLQKSEV